MPWSRPRATISAMSSSVSSIIPLPWLIRWTRSSRSPAASTTARNGSGPSTEGISTRYWPPSPKRPPEGGSSPGPGSGRPDPAGDRPGGGGSRPWAGPHGRRGQPSRSSSPGPHGREGGRLGQDPLDDGPGGAPHGRVGTEAGGEHPHRRPPVGEDPFPQLLQQ